MLPLSWGLLMGGQSNKPDPYFSSVVLLMHCNGADGATTITDVKGHTLTAAGNAQLDTAQTRFGSASLLLDGTGDYVTSADSADWDVGSGDFTVECWIRPAASVSTILVSHWVSGGGTARAWSLEYNNTGTISGVCLVGSTASSATSTGTVALNTWAFVSFQRVEGNLYVHVNGVLDGSAAISGTVNNSTGNLAIGAYSGGQQPFNGWVDEARITKGVARYGSGNYTPPVGPFPDF